MLPPLKDQSVRPSVFQGIRPSTDDEMDPKSPFARLLNDASDPSDDGLATNSKSQDGAETPTTKPKKMPDPDALTARNPDETPPSESGHHGWHCSVPHWGKWMVTEEPAAQPNVVGLGADGFLTGEKLVSADDTVVLSENAENFDGPGKSTNPSSSINQSQHRNELPSGITDAVAARSQNLIDGSHQSKQPSTLDSLISGTALPASVTASVISNASNRPILTPDEDVQLENKVDATVLPRQVNAEPIAVTSNVDLSTIVKAATIASPNLAGTPATRDSRAQTLSVPVPPMGSQSIVVDSKSQSLNNSLSLRGDESTDEMMRATRIMPEKQSSILEAGSRIENGLDVKKGGDASTASLGAATSTILEAVKATPEWVRSATSVAATTNFNLHKENQVLQTLKVQLQPVELGRVALIMRQLNNQVHVEIHTESEKAMNALAQDQDNLLRILKSLGHKVDLVVVVDARNENPSMNSSTQGQSNSQMSSDQDSKNSEKANSSQSEYVEGQSDEQMDVADSTITQPEQLNII